MRRLAFVIGWVGLFPVLLPFALLIDRGDLRKSFGDWWDCWMEIWTREDI